MEKIHTHTHAPNDDDDEENNNVSCKWHTLFRCRIAFKNTLHVLNYRFDLLMIYYQPNENTQ